MRLMSYNDLPTDDTAKIRFIVDNHVIPTIKKKCKKKVYCAGLAGHSLDKVCAENNIKFFAAGNVFAFFSKEDFDFINLIFEYRNLFITDINFDFDT